MLHYTVPVWFFWLKLVAIVAAVVVLWTAVAETQSFLLAALCGFVIFGFGFATDWFIKRDREEARREGLDITYYEDDLEIESPPRLRRPELRE